MRTASIFCIFLVSLPVFIHVDSCAPGYGLKITFYDNKKISQSVMWTLNNLTKAECLAECYKEKYCLSVNFSPLEPACVALRERFAGVSVATEHEPGYTLFQIKKPLSQPYSDCSINLDCASLSNSHCHQGSCRCDIGYGPNGTKCSRLDACVELSDNFTMYTNCVIVGYDIQSSGGKTRPACQQFCLDNPSCTSADYDFVSSICYLQQAFWVNIPAGALLTNSPIFDFYQRDCKIW